MKRKSESPRETEEVKKKVLTRSAVRMLQRAAPHKPVKTKIVRDPDTGLWRREIVKVQDKPGDYWC